MFKAEISSPKTLKSAFDSVGYVNDEVKIVVDSEGLRIDTMDKGSTIFVHLELKASLFDEFICDEPESYTVDMDEIMKILKLADKDDRVILSEEQYSLIITLEGENSTTFKIGLIDEINEKTNPPKMDFPTSIDIETKTLDNMINRISKFSDDTLKILIGSEYLKISINDPMMVDVENQYMHGEKVDGEEVSLFSIERLISIMKAKSFSDAVKLKMGTNIPMGLEFELVSGEGVLSYLLAPYIEKE